MLLKTLGTLIVQSRVTAAVVAVSQDSCILECSVEPCKGVVGQNKDTDGVQSRRGRIPELRKVEIT